MTGMRRGHIIHHSRKMLLATAADEDDDTIAPANFLAFGVSTAPSMRKNGPITSIFVP
jgi:hypothetical protein